jgi:hypothetical protein
MGVRATVVDCSTDETPPTITITTPADGAVYLLNQVVDAVYECKDSDTGVEACDGSVANGEPIDTSSVGAHTFVVTATDVAGNTATETHTYSVIEPSDYLFDGFFGPVDNDGWNVARAGAAIPIQFSLGGYWGMDVLASVVSVPTACHASALFHEVGEEAAVTPGQSSLSYDAESDAYNYVWKTQRSWAGTCRLFTLTLDDGSPHTATFAFK